MEPGGEEAVRKRAESLYGLGWDVLALGRAQAHLRAGRQERALQVLEARFGDRTKMRRSEIDFIRLGAILDHHAFVPGDMLERIRADLAALPADSVGRVRTWVGMLRCRARLAAADPKGARRCLDDLDPVVAGRPIFFLRYYAAINAGRGEEAAALCAAEAERAGLDARLLEKWLLADLQAGRYAQALARMEQAPEKLLHFGFMDMGPARARILFQGLARLSTGEAELSALPVPDQEALRETASPQPRLHLAMRALADGDAAAATRALGDQNLHYSLGMQRGWRPFARALFDLADPSGRDLVFVLQGEVGSRAQTFGMDLARLLWLQAEIAQLQPAEAAARTRAAMARHQAAVPIIAELNWGRY